MAIHGILFDWRGTLFFDLPIDEWVRSSAKAIGRNLSDAEVAAVNLAIMAAERDADVIERNRRADASPDLHRDGGLYLLERAGIDSELAKAIYERDGDLDSSQPYAETPELLRALKAQGLKIAIISDIHYDIRRSFRHYGLSDCVDGWSLSFEHGFIKPEAGAFKHALDAVGLSPAEVLMVGDNPRRDSGAVALGIPTLIIPAPPGPENPGLGLVLAMTDAVVS